MSIDAPPDNTIAFVSDRRIRKNRDIWLLQPDGSHLRLVSALPCSGHDSNQEMHPEWSPDGQKLAFISAATEYGDDASVCVFDFYNKRTISLAQAESILAFSWAADSSHIVYSSSEELWIASLDRPDHPELLHGVPGDPLSWASDGLKIGFGQGKQKAHDDFTGLQVIGVDASLFQIQAEGRPMGSGAGIIKDIAWSPDGAYMTVSYMASRWGGHLALFEVKDQVVFPKQTIHDYSSSPQGMDYCGSHWSSDGTRIVFVEGEPYYDGECSGTVYVADAGFSGVEPLLQEPGFYMSPSWSPDDQSILFSRRRETRNQEGHLSPVGSSESIWIVASDGTGPRQLIGGDGNYHGEPSWQPAIASP